MIAKAYLLPIDTPVNYPKYEGYIVFAGTNAVGYLQSGCSWTYIYDINDSECTDFVYRVVSNTVRRTNMMRECIAALFMRHGYLLSIEPMVVINSRLTNTHLME